MTRDLRIRLSMRPLFTLLATACLASACFERADRWLQPQEKAPFCTIGTTRCTANLERCESGANGPEWRVLEECSGRGLVCAPLLEKCTRCAPASAVCDGQTVMRCDAEGNQRTPEKVCDPSQGAPCRGGACVHLCLAASERRSNVGCEYWAVDLDNARIDDTLNAAAQQFAVVISNPEPDVTATVTIDQDDTLPGQPNSPTNVALAQIPPFSLRVFKLGPREVDGSPPGQFDSGTHTALTRAAYRIRSNFPVVAYQFNPLENVNVFSNDASLLKPTEAVRPDSGSMQLAYVALGWPQTIASTDNPETNFDPQNPSDLRAFLTLVGTRDNTQIRVEPATRLLAGGPVPEIPAGGRFEFTLGAFDVLNLESDDFNADFTSSKIFANAPLIVFSGGEASDAPFFRTLSERKCCADHLEEQLDHVRTAGRRFVAAVSPNRTDAVMRAGGLIGHQIQTEYFRVIATTANGARIKTTLPGDQAAFDLPGIGAYVNIASSTNFILDSDQPVMMMSVSPSQADANVPNTLPGGDPSMLIIPPVEQYRNSYVFLTPDKYGFDFLRIIAAPDAPIVLDGVPLAQMDNCRAEPGDGLDKETRKKAIPDYVVHTCQLSFPVLDPNKNPPENLLPGIQNDGVHRVESSHKISVLVDGFDSFVSYAYAAGTELEFIVPE